MANQINIIITTTTIKANYLFNFDNFIIIITIVTAKEHFEVVIIISFVIVIIINFINIIILKLV